MRSYFFGILMVLSLASAESQTRGAMPVWENYRQFTYTVLGNSSPRNDPSQDFTLEISFPRPGKALVILSRKNRTPVVTEYMIAENPGEKSVFLLIPEKDTPALKLEVRRDGVVISSPAVLEDYGYASFRLE